MHERNCSRRLLSAAPGASAGRNIAFVAAAFILAVFSGMGCSGLTGWQIPGTEKSAEPTTKVYFVLENVETIPKDVRSKGEIYVDGAFFGHTKRPTYYKFVGNALVVGTVQIEKEKIHSIRIAFPGYEPFEKTRYFGTLDDYSIAFRLIMVTPESGIGWAVEKEAGRADEE